MDRESLLRKGPKALVMVRKGDKRLRIAVHQLPEFERKGFELELRKPESPKTEEQRKDDRGQSQNQGVRNDQRGGRPPAPGARRG